ncbi:hypothetical protein PORCRE_371 [Porphyromonas crevioricanis JCM 15906]|uniref:Uncharacterized protein n=1 Tax=Porphyromonas crevioricanis JCM 15906 TaxID=1305617 RepID=T1DR49_9PORP|nr:hypothetical protein PORCRE_371 [Porphyromonas crevioricanis JCM 15906]
MGDCVCFLKMSSEKDTEKRSFLFHFLYLRSSSGMQISQLSQTGKTEW